MLLGILCITIAQYEGSGINSTHPDKPPNTDSTFPEFDGSNIIVEDPLGINNSRYILTDSFCSGALRMEVNADSSITISLNSDVNNSYGKYTWMIEDSLTAPSKTIMSASGTDPFLNWDPSYGHYALSLFCHNKNGTTTYNADITYTHDVPRTYDWKYMGQSYHIDLTFDYVKNFQTYNETEYPEKRIIKDFNKTTEFVMISEPIANLGDSLINLYIAEFGDDVPLNDQNFASFILGFVQLEFEYETDLELYGQEEYFAYPTEVLYFGTGDCEDTSILCAALFEYCGYDTAVCIMPGHAVAGVALDNFKPTYNSRSGFEQLSMTVDGKTYYACETTTSNVLSVGLVPAQGYNGHSYQYWISLYPEKYGFKIVQ